MYEKRQCKKKYKHKHKIVFDGNFEQQAGEIVHV